MRIGKIAAVGFALVALMIGIRPDDGGRHPAHPHRRT